ncbi:MAG: response regulator [Candidatus Rokubacteria bacterium]|nr:response regulator [Candidatus Rokubacteria bacterium]
MDFVSWLTGLAQNIALLLSLTLLYSVVRPMWSRASANVQPLFAGALFGLISVAGMHTPIAVAPGVIADARVIPVLLAGPFGGPRAAVAAALVASAYRWWLGGAGAAAGIGTILTAGLMGVIVGLRWHGRERYLPPVMFVLLGLALDAVLLAWAVALPTAGLAREVLAAAALPIGVFVPAGTLVLGTLLVNESRRHAEREQLSLTQSAIERTAEALFWIDAEGRIVNTNPAAARLTGYSRAELHTMRVWDLDLTAAGDAWSWFWRTARAAGSVAAASRYRRKDGSEFPVETSNDFVEYHGREWISMFVRDVTERVRAEDERARRLERERALRADAEEANVLKDQFLATLSHELRTPLTSILGYARLLQTRALDGAATTHALAVIERNSRAQRQIVDDLLDLSAIVLRKLRIEPRPTDLARLVEEESDAARPEAEARQVGLCCLVHARPRVAAEGGRLQQVVRNLISNALKFTPAGGIVDVLVDVAAGRARVQVRDTGRGIDAAFLPHVFDRFRQADSSMTRSYGGLGIGLAIVRHVVELHGGTVTAASAGEGRGATFTVTLPLLVAPPESGDTPPPRSSGADERLPALGGVRVLVVDDETETRELVAMVLAGCGAEVTAAASADQALLALDRVKPDVLVTDLAMPLGDGFELIRKIRLRPRDRGGAVPAAALTAAAGRDTAERALAAGFEAHVAKPFEPADLARVVARLARRPAA